MSQVLKFTTPPCRRHSGERPSATVGWQKFADARSDAAAICAGVRSVQGSGTDGYFLTKSAVPASREEISSTTLRSRFAMESGRAIAIQREVFSEKALGGRGPCKAAGRMLTERRPARVCAWAARGSPANRNSRKRGKRNLALGRMIERRLTKLKPGLS